MPIMAEGARENVHSLHWGIAEEAKVALLDGRHAGALKGLREAIRLAVACKAPEVFFRHYMQCVLEALELSGDFREVADLCREQDSYYRQLAARGSLFTRDHGSILERLGVAELQSGRREEAAEALRRAVDCAGKGVLPLSELILQWLERGLNVPAQQLRQQQHRHRYFVIRPDTVDRNRASASRRTRPAQTAFASPLGI